MANPFAQIREAVQEALLEVEQVKWTDAYNGEDWQDADFAEIRRRAALRGNGVLVRIPRTRIVESSPMSTDENTIWLHLICAAVKVADRTRSAEAAEELAWQCYAKLRRTKTGGDFLLIPWRLSGIAVEYQNPNCTIVSVMLESGVDFAYWTED